MKILLFALLLCASEVLACSSNADCDAGTYCKLGPLCGANGGNHLPGVCEERPDACVQIYEPVCGCDLVTYSNECELRMSGASKLYSGVCFDELPEGSFDGFDGEPIVPCAATEKTLCAFLNTHTALYRTSKFLDEAAAKGAAALQAAFEEIGMDTTGRFRNAQGDWYMIIDRCSDGTYASIPPANAGVTNGDKVISNIWDIVKDVCEADPNRPHFRTYTVGERDGEKHVLYIQKKLLGETYIIGTGFYDFSPPLHLPCAASSSSYCAIRNMELMMGDAIMRLVGADQAGNGQNEALLQAALDAISANVQGTGMYVWVMERWPDNDRLVAHPYNKGQSTSGVLGAHVRDAILWASRPSAPHTGGWARYTMPTADSNGNPTAGAEKMSRTIPIVLNGRWYAIGMGFDRRRSTFDEAEYGECNAATGAGSRECLVAHAYGALGHAWQALAVAESEAEALADYMSTTIDAAEVDARVDVALAAISQAGRDAVAADAGEVYAWVIEQDFVTPAAGYRMLAHPQPEILGDQSPYTVYPSTLGRVCFHTAGPSWVIYAYDFEKFIASEAGLVEHEKRAVYVRAPVSSRRLAIGAGFWVMNGADSAGSDVAVTTRAAQLAMQAKADAAKAMGDHDVIGDLVSSLRHAEDAMREQCDRKKCRRAVRDLIDDAIDDVKEYKDSSSSSSSSSTSFSSSSSSSSSS